MSFEEEQEGNDFIIPGFLMLGVLFVEGIIIGAAIGIIIFIL